MSNRDALKLHNCDEVLVNKTGTVATVITIIETGKNVLVEAIDPILGYMTFTPEELS